MSQFQDGGHGYVISCNKVLPPGEASAGTYAAASISS